MTAAATSTLDLVTDINLHRHARRVLIANPQLAHEQEGGLETLAAITAATDPHHWTESQLLEAIQYEYRARPRWFWGQRPKDLTGITVSARQTAVL